MDIVIDWTAINSKAEFYQLLLSQLAAPEWHGRNLDASSDSIAVGSINGVEPPYRIVIRGVHQVRNELSRFAWDVSEVIFAAAKERSGITVLFEETRPEK